MATTDTVTITAVRLLDGGAKIKITAKMGAETVSVVVYATRLQGHPVCGVVAYSLWQEYQREGAFCYAMETALRAVGASGISPARLRERLLRRGIKREVVEAVLDELMRRGYLKECDGALQEARRALAKGWGNRRILMDVHAKGYGSEALLSVQQYLEGEDSLLRLRTLLRRRRVTKIPANEAERRRLIAFLVRYGYAQEEIKKVLPYEEPYLEE